MAAIILMIVATVGIMTFFVKTGKAGKTSAAEIVLSRAWSNRFSRIDLEDKVGKQNARDCGKGSVQKTLGKPCNHERRQHINDLYSRHVIISRVKFPQNDARRCRQKQTEQRFQAVSCRYGKAPLEKSAYAVRHKSHLSLSHAQELQ